MIKREVSGPLLPGFLIDCPSPSSAAPAVEQLRHLDAAARRLAPVGSGEFFASVAAKSRSLNSSMRL